MPISTGRPIRFLRASQVVMIPSCGERMFIDSICSSTISIRSLRALGRDLGLGPLCLDLEQFLRSWPERSFSACKSSEASLALGFLPLGDQAVELFLKFLALELDDDVSRVHPLIVVQRHRGDDAGARARKSCAALPAATSRGPRS